MGTRTIHMNQGRGNHSLTPSQHNSSHNQCSQAHPPMQRYPGTFARLHTSLAVFNCFTVLRFARHRTEINANGIQRQKSLAAAVRSGDITCTSSRATYQCCGRRTTYSGTLTGHRFLVCLATLATHGMLTSKAVEVRQRSWQSRAPACYRIQSDPAH